MALTIDAAAAIPRTPETTIVTSEVASFEHVGVRVLDRFDVVIERGAASASFGNVACLSVEFGGSAFQSCCIEGLDQRIECGEQVEADGGM